MTKIFFELFFVSFLIIFLADIQVFCVKTCACVFKKAGRVEADKKKTIDNANTSLVFMIF